LDVFLTRFQKFKYYKNIASCILAFLVLHEVIRITFAKLAS
jgi:hypothetical protein